MDPMSAASYRTQRPESPEDLWQPLYDRANYAAAGAAQITLFSTAKGQNATLIRNGATGTFAKTYRDTNMDAANVVPSKLFKFIGISIAYIHEDDGDVANSKDRNILAHGGWLQFRIIDKDILIIPLVAIPELNPLNIASTTANATTILGSACGGGDSVGMYKFGVPITLEPYQQFTVALNFDGSPTTTKAVDIQVFLQGYMRRPT